MSGPSMTTTPVLVGLLIHAETKSHSSLFTGPGGSVSKLRDKRLTTRFCTFFNV